MVGSDDMKVALEVLDELSKTDIGNLKEDTQKRIDRLRKKLEDVGQVLESLLGDHIRRLDIVLRECKKIQNDVWLKGWIEERDRYRFGVMFERYMAAGNIWWEMWRFKLELLRTDQTQIDCCVFTSISKRAPKMKSVDWRAYVFDVALSGAGCVPGVGIIAGVLSGVKTTVSTFFRRTAKFKESVSQVMNILALLYFLDAMESKGIAAVEALVVKRKKEFEEIKEVIDGWESFVERMKADIASFSDGAK